MASKKHIDRIFVAGRDTDMGESRSYAHFFVDQFGNIQLGFSNALVRFIMRLAYATKSAIPSLIIGPL